MQVEQQLNRIRGAADPKAHNARTIAALTSNPGCARRAVLDAAGIDKAKLSARIDCPFGFGQSPLALSRGNAFEALVKANGCAELLRLLREELGLPVPAVAYTNLEDVGGNTNQDARCGRTRRLLLAAARGEPDAGTLFDHPLLRVQVAGRHVYLEPDVIAFRWSGRFHVVEIKSFSVIDGQADPVKVRDAAVQAAVYVLALRQLLAGHGIDEQMVSDEVFLVCPRDFSNRPVATCVPVTKKLGVLRRQLARLERIESILAALPEDLCLDLGENGGTPVVPASRLIEALGHIPARYAPECLASCEMAYFCRQEARDSTDTLGRQAREELGGVDTVTAALRLAEGAVPAAEQVEAAQTLTTALRLRSECIDGVA